MIAYITAPNQEMYFFCLTSFYDFTILV
jgi:hypothetical protein